jgi:CheY-like chemotaxis protein
LARELGGSGSALDLCLIDEALLAALTTERGERECLQALERAGVRGGAVVLLSCVGANRDGAALRALGLQQRLFKPVKRAELRATAAKCTSGKSLSWTTLRAAAGPIAKPTSRARVLVAEDNAANQKFLARLLERMGLACQLVANGQEALQALEMLDFDLVLMDAMMPELDGLEATVRLRERERRTGTRRIPVVALTANAMVGDRDRCLEAGCDDYVAKPVDPGALQQLIRRWLNDGSGPPGAHPGRPESARTPPAALPAAGRNVEAGWNVLVVEDNPINQRLFRRILTSLGYRCEVVADGHAALEAVERGEFSLALMDVMVPGLDGIEATRAIREREQRRGGHTPILAVTASREQNLRERALAAGADEFREKPLGVDVLQSLLGELLPRWISPSRAEPGPPAALEFGP